MKSPDGLSRLARVDRLATIWTFVDGYLFNAFYDHRRVRKYRTGDSDPDHRE